MNRKTAKTLFNKGSWTGIEVGQAYLYTLSEHQKAIKEKKEFKPPFTREELDTMENGLKDRAEWIAFKCYSYIYSSLIDTANAAEANIQQFFNGYYRNLYALKDCMTADTALKAANKYPLIMTQKQYDRIKADLLEDRKAFKTCFYSILLDYIEKMAADLEQAPIGLRKAIEATKLEPCTNSRILGNYNNDFGEGYYTLPDGTRSDSMSLEEWQQLLKDRFLAKHKLTINGEEATPEETAKNYHIQHTLDLEKLFFTGLEGIEQACKEKGIDLESKGFTYEQFLNYLEDELFFCGSTILDKDSEALFKYIIGDEERGLEWHTKEEAPELTKFDVLEDNELLLRYKGGLADDVELEQQIEEFKADYATVYKEALKEIKKLLPKAAKLKEQDFIQPLFTYGEVAKAGLTIYDFFIKDIDDRDIIDFYLMPDTTENLQKRHRAFYSGIAILQESSFNNYNIAENGDYIEEQSNPYTLMESIDSITDDEEREEEIKGYREYLIKPALRFLYAYNELIELIGNIYDTSCIDIMKKSMLRSESQIEAYNGLLYHFYRSVYGNKEEQARKRKLIKEVFTPIEVEQLKPSADNVKALKKKLKDTAYSSKAFTMLQDFLPLVYELMGKGA